MLEDYWDLMPKYQNVRLEDLEVLRILFGFFPTYRNSPLQPGWDRTLQIGDASGIQSPLSFGGFGALMRHIPRIKRAVVEALQVGPCCVCTCPCVRMHACVQILMCSSICEHPQSPSNTAEAASQCSMCFPWLVSHAQVVMLLPGHMRPLQTVKNPCDMACHRLMLWTRALWDSSMPTLPG